MKLIVSDKHMMNHRKTETVFTEVFLQPSQTHSEVYQQGVVWSSEHIAVSTASTTK